MDPVTVPPTKPVRELARMMIDGHIHRIIVVDEQCRPVGMVSSTDILAVMANAPSEKKESGQAPEA
jgi:CBS domain-containing protein